jgi:hypothetical protein
MKLSVSPRLSSLPLSPNFFISFLCQTQQQTTRAFSVSRLPDLFFQFQLSIGVPVNLYSAQGERLQEHFT